MAKFLLMYHVGDEPEEPTPEVMDTWMAWFAKLGDAIVDLGSQFGSSATVGSDGAVTAGTGVRPATGYTVIQTSDMEEATRLAAACPGLISGGSVRVYETTRMD